MNARLVYLALLGSVFSTMSVAACPACDENKIATEESDSQARIPHLTPAQVRDKIQARTIIVYDANPIDIFNKNHVPNARRVEYDQVKASDLPADKRTPIVFYCMNEQCGASPIAAKTAKELGWTNVYLMPAGIQGWIKAGLPLNAANAH